MKTFHHAIVVGASSGLGEALARRLAADGCRVAMVARRGETLKRIAREIEDIVGEERAFPFVHDVTDWQSVPALFEEITRTLGGLDLVIYNSGLMLPVEFEEYDTEKDVAMVEVNLMGAIAWLNPAARRFYNLGQGTLVGIGSIAGDRGRSASPVYNTTKAALATFLEALRNRVGRRGVKVVTIKPGFIDTPMTHGRPGLFWLITADRAAQIILQHARKGHKNAYVPARWRLVSWVIRSIPSWIFRRLKI